MSNTRNLHLFLLGKLLNHDITADELRHCKRPDFLQISDLMTSKSFLLTLPICIRFSRVDKPAFRIIDKIRFMVFK